MFLFCILDAGASTNPCSDVYAGPNPLSVPETVGLSDVMQAHKARLKLYLTVHSYGQVFLYPYGYSSTSRAPDHRQLVSSLLLSSHSPFSLILVLLNLLPILKGLPEICQTE